MPDPATTQGPARVCPACGGELPADQTVETCVLCRTQGATGAAPLTPESGSKPASVCRRCGGPLRTKLPGEFCLACFFDAGMEPLPVGDHDLAVPALAAGQRLFGKRYQLERELGRGGMGVVWLARAEHLEQRVALKFLPSLFADDLVALDDLKRETRRSLELTHHHIVRIHDFHLEDGVAAISMEYVDGDTLRNLQRAQPLGCFEVDTLRPWLAQLCDALAYAHETARIAHRDLKPGNLLVSSSGELKVADFGIAASLRESVMRVTRRPRAGTPAYMSPQQFAGELPTPADDLYALGATLYELLTGRPPFRSLDWEKLAVEIAEGVPPPMSERQRERGIEGAAPIPLEWEATVAACLEKDPTKRPQSSAEIARRLSSTSTPTRRKARARHPLPGGLARKLLEMNWVIVAMAFLLSIAGVMAVYSVTNSRTQDFWHRQALWAAVGGVVFLVASLSDYRFVKWIALPVYVAGSVIAVLAYNGLSGYGRPSFTLSYWLYRFEPAQMTLVGGVLMLGLLMGEFRRLPTMLRLLTIGAVVLWPLLLTLSQGGIGMTFVWLFVVLGMLFAGGLAKRYLMLLLLAGVALVAVVVNFVWKPYQRLRLLAFIDPAKWPFYSGWPTHESLDAIRSGGWAGRGFLAIGSQVEDGFHPGTTVHTDYIFTSIAEQFGFVGGLTLISSFGILILAMLCTARMARDRLGLVITVGFAVQIFSCVLLNLGMTLGLAPFTGLPAPLLSFGESSLVLTLFGLGVVNSISMHRNAWTAGSVPNAKPTAS